MPIKIFMPALSPTMRTGNLAKWLKNEGDKVKPGDVIAEIETDKATMEMEAVDEGVLAKIVVLEGSEDVEIGSLIAIILEDGEGISALDSIVMDQQITLPDSENKTPMPSAESAPHTRAQDDARIFASPLAKRIAKERGIDLKSITGSGPHGRIIKTDILSSETKFTHTIARNPTEFTVQKYTNVGKIIAKRLLESKQTIPHFYLTIECNIDKLLDLRTEMNNIMRDSAHYKLSVNDFIIKASALTMRDVPGINASFDEEHIIVYNNVDIAVAVASQTGLITPVIKNADHKTLPELSNEIKDLAVRARANKLTPEEFQGGGFTISNLGMYGIKQFSAIINPPQSCILAVGEGTKRVIADGQEVKVATIMDVTLSCDHRVVDGALGAQFLQQFKKYIESPVRMILT